MWGDSSGVRCGVTVMGIGVWGVTAMGIGVGVTAMGIDVGDRYGDRCG